jgi:hypothetical protein
MDGKKGDPSTSVHLLYAELACGVEKYSTGCTVLYLDCKVSGLSLHRRA